MLTFSFVTCLFHTFSLNILLIPFLSVGPMYIPLFKTCANWEFKKKMNTWLPLYNFAKRRNENQRRIKNEPSLRQAVRASKLREDPNKQMCAKTTFTSP